jgi:hypothetical protein
MEVLTIQGIAIVFADNQSSAYCLDSDSQGLWLYCCNLRSVATDAVNVQRVYCNDSTVQSFDAQDHILGFLELWVGLWVRTIAGLNVAWIRFVRFHPSGFVSFGYFRHGDWWVFSRIFYQLTAQGYRIYQHHVLFLIQLQDFANGL